MQGALITDNTSSDAFGIAIVLATILVSALCYAFILQAGILIA
jgi:hypothetical protein